MCVRSTRELAQKLHTHRWLTAVESSLSADAFRFVLEYIFFLFSLAVVWLFVLVVFGFVSGTDL